MQCNRLHQTYLNKQDRMCRLQLSRGIRAMWLRDVCIAIRMEQLKNRPADCTLIVEWSSFFPVKIFKTFKMNMFI